jgi:hypothetical protein
MRLRIAAGTFLLTIAVASVAHALPIWNEVGDAGSLPGSAQIIAGAGPVTTITGTLADINDEDMFFFEITSAALFSASTVGTPGTVADTQLFLFRSSGLGAIANDDSPGGGTLRSQIPAGSMTTFMLPVGFYYLAISSFNNNPVSVGGLIFPDAPFTGVFGPTGPGGGSPVSNWSAGGGGSGTYTINLTAAQAVPEPTAMFLVGTGLIGWAARQRRNRNK